MFNVQVTSTAMKLLPVACLCLLARCGKTFADENGPGVITVVATEGSDTVLPCSLSTKKNIEFKLFDWTKDGQKEVFLYDAGLHFNIGHPGQDKRFEGRVSHFQQELKRGNASIIIRNTKVSDSGEYSCIFPRFQPSQRFHIKLVVGAAPEPVIIILGQTDDGVLIQCEVQGASPKPKVEWKDSAGNIVPAEEPQVSERGGSYDVKLQTTVTKSDRYRCEATQEEINHQIYTETFVSVNESSGFPTGWVVFASVLCGLLVVGVLLVVLVAKGVITLNCNRDPSSRPETNVPLRNCGDELKRRHQTASNHPGQQPDPETTSLT